MSRITEALHEEFEAFASLRRQAGCREGILVTWAILKVLVHLSLGNQERYES